MRRLLKIDLGCGPNKKSPDFLGVDRLSFDGKVDVVCDLSSGRWPWDDATVDEAHSSHFVEHLNQVERCHFFNELYRVLKPGSTCQIIVPHWGNARAYGDPTHAWPPVSEWLFLYLNKEWRMANAPHADKANWCDGYDCDFDHTCVTSFNNGHPEIMGRNQEMQNFALRNYRDVAMDIWATVTKRA